MTTLTYVATMKDDELDAARLLSELGCGSVSSLVCVKHEIFLQCICLYDGMNESFALAANDLY